MNETQTNGGTVASFNAPNMTTGNNCEDWLGVGFGTAQAYENTFYYVGANSTANYAELGLLSEPGMAIFGTGDVSIRNTTDSAPLSVTGNAIISGTVTQSATSTMLKANGSGTLVAATAGTDYQGVIAKVTGTLSSGTATISNGAITASSAISACHLATSAANAGALYVSALSPGSVTIKSTNPSDNDTFVITIQ